MVLSMTEKLGVHFIPLHPPGDALDQFVVESTADSSGQGRVRSRDSSAFVPNVSCAYQRMREGRKFSHRDGRAWAEQERVALHAERNWHDVAVGTHWKIVRAVMSAEVCDNPYPREELALEGAFPPVQIGPGGRARSCPHAGSIDIAPRVGIADKDISRGRNLRLGEAPENNNACDGQNLDQRSLQELNWSEMEHYACRDADIVLRAAKKMSVNRV